MPMGHLADELDVALPNATGIINRMAERGLVQRSNDESDRRVVLISLTGEGDRLIAEMEAGRRARMGMLIGTMDNVQQMRLLESVKDLHAAARQLAEAEKGSA